MVRPWNMGATLGSGRPIPTNIASWPSERRPFTVTPPSPPKLRPSTTCTHITIHTHISPFTHAHTHAHTHTHLEGPSTKISKYVTFFSSPTAKDTFQRGLSKVSQSTSRATRHSIERLPSYYRDCYWLYLKSW